MSEREALSEFRPLDAANRLDGDVNYYVIVPFATLKAAEWASGEVGMKFDCCYVISAAAIDPQAPLLGEVVPDE